MKKNISRKKALLILNWFKQKFGKSKYYNKPIILRIYKSQGTSTDKDGCQGTYYNGNISIYLGSINSVMEVCKNIAHEYKHYLISDKYNIEYSRIAHILNNKYKNKINKDLIYYIHPHEKRCRRFENKWGPICFKELKNKLYKYE